MFAHPHKDKVSILVLVFIGIGVPMPGGVMLDLALDYERSAKDKFSLHPSILLNYGARHCAAPVLVTLY